MSSSLAADREGLLLHARARWVGVPLLISGLAQVAWALLMAGLGGAWSTFFLAMFGTGLGLASFGANHDSAMALALRVRQAAPGADGAPVVKVPSAIAAELDEELGRDRSGTLSLRAQPRIAMALPVIAMLVQALVAWRLLRG